MNPICPNCGAEQTHACSACDDGYPDYNGGSKCNDCGACIMHDDWLEDADDYSPASDYLDGDEYY